MKHKKIIKILKYTSKSEDENIEREIALGALNSDSPIEFLIESYQDTSLLYHIDETFFDEYYDEIEMLRIQYIRKKKREVFVGTWDLKIALSYFAYQKILKEMLKKFGLKGNNNT